MTNTTNNGGSSTLQQQVTDLLEGADSDVINQFFGSEWSDKYSKYDTDSDKEFKDELSKLKITTEHVDNFGGEGEGEDYWSVYKFKQLAKGDALFTKGSEEVLIKFQGWHQSYKGREFTEFFVCKPVPKTGFDYVLVK